MPDELKFLSSTYRAGYVEHIYCSGGSLSLAGLVPLFSQKNLPTELEVKVFGRRKIDFMFLCGTVAFISKRTHDVFQKANLKNYRVVPVKGPVLAGYFAIVPTFCLERIDALTIIKSSWDGSDFCSDTDVMRTIVSSRVAGLIMENRFTGVEFTDLSLV